MTKKRDGKYINDFVVEDGDSVRVPLMICDSLAGYRPGFAQLTDEMIAKRWERPRRYDTARPGSLARADRKTDRCEAQTRSQ
jgi:hypothetical protein